RIGANGCLPEKLARGVRIRHSDDPLRGEAIPEKEGGAAAEPFASMRSKDEKLRHVEHPGIVARDGTTSDENEARGPVANPDHESKMRVGRGPVERKPVVAKPAVGADLHRENLAEIVHVELEQVGDQRRAALVRGLERDGLVRHAYTPNLS